jgi:hypothetical protein
MALPTHVTVTAPEGRTTPVHHEDGVEPGGGQLVIIAGRVRRVKWSQTTMRSRNRGDLILCNMDGEPVDSAEAAAAPADFPWEGRIAKAKKGSK